MASSKTGSLEQSPAGDNIASGATKKDFDKPPVYRGVLARFPRAILAVANVSQFGFNKYGTWDGWQAVPDGQGRYTDADARHLVYDAIGPVDADSQLLHNAQHAWNALARLELDLIEREKQEKKNA